MVQHSFFSTLSEGTYSIIAGFIRWAKVSKFHVATIIKFHLDLELCPFGGISLHLGLAAILFAHTGTVHCLLSYSPFLQSFDHHLSAAYPVANQFLQDNYYTKCLLNSWKLGLMVFQCPLVPCCVQKPHLNISFDSHAISFLYKSAICHRQLVCLSI